jgi:hypothetical protein
MFPRIHKQVSPTPTDNPSPTATPLSHEGVRRDADIPPSPAKKAWLAAPAPCWRATEPQAFPPPTPPHSNPRRNANASASSGIMYSASGGSVLHGIMSALRPPLGRLAAAWTFWSKRISLFGHECPLAADLGTWQLHGHFWLKESNLCFRANRTTGARRPPSTHAGDREVPLTDTPSCEADNAAPCLRELHPRGSSLYIRNGTLLPPAPVARLTSGAHQPPPRLRTPTLAR